MKQILKLACLGSFVGLVSHNAEAQSTLQGVFVSAGTVEAIGDNGFFGGALGQPVGGVFEGANGTKIHVGFWAAQDESAFAERNDLIQNAEVILAEGLSVDTYDNSRAGAEVGEPGHLGNGTEALASLWWEVRSESKTRVNFDVVSPQEKVIAAYQGSDPEFSELNRLTGGTVTQGLNSLGFDAVAGNRYFVAVDSDEINQGEFKVRVDLNSYPVIDLSNPVDGSLIEEDIIVDGTLSDDTGIQGWNVNVALKNVNGEEISTRDFSGSSNALSVATTLTEISNGVSLDFVKEAVFLITATDNEGLNEIYTVAQLFDPPLNIDNSSITFDLSAQQLSLNGNFINGEEYKVYVALEFDDPADDVRELRNRGVLNPELKDNPLIWIKADEEDIHMSSEGGNISMTVDLSFALDTLGTSIKNKILADKSEFQFKVFVRIHQ